MARNNKNFNKSMTVLLKIRLFITLENVISDRTRNNYSNIPIGLGVLKSFLCFTLDVDVIVQCHISIPPDAFGFLTCSGGIEM